MFTALGVSQAGTSHQQRCVPCQDCNLHRVLPDGTVIGIIADGVGASPVSQTGAQAASETAINTVESLLLSGQYSAEQHTEILRRAFALSRSAVLDAARAGGQDVGMFETTLTAVIVTDRHIACGHCGDGGVIVLSDQGEMFPLTRQQTGTYAGQVFTLVSHPDRWTFSDLNIRCAGVIMATDGMYDYFSRIRENDRSRYLLGYLSPCTAPEATRLALQKVLSRHVGSQDILEQVDDDRTVLVICQTGRPLPAEVRWQSPADEGTSARAPEYRFVRSDDQPAATKAAAAEPETRSKVSMIAAAIGVLLVIAALAFWFFRGSAPEEPISDGSSAPVSVSDVSSSDLASSSDAVTSGSDITGGTHE